MKKVFLAAMALLAFCVVQSCEKDNAGDSGVVGTWQMRADEYHYFDATFKSDGTYEWVWMGAGGIMKDAGSYTYADKTITMKPSSFYEEDYENPGKLIKKSASDFGWSGPRTVNVVSYSDGVAYWHWQGDFLMENSEFFNEGEPIIIFRKGYDYKIKKSDLVGTWEDEGSDGALTRIVIKNDNTYALYWSWNDEDGTLSVSKETGTWELSSNVLSLTAITHYSSFKSLGWNAETQQNEYIYYNVDPVTLEAEQWESYDYSKPIKSDYYLVLSDGKMVTNYGTFTKK